MATDEDDGNEMKAKKMKHKQLNLMTFFIGWNCNTTLLVAVFYSMNKSEIKSWILLMCLRILNEFFNIELERVGCYFYGNFTDLMGQMATGNQD